MGEDIIEESKVYDNLYNPDYIYRALLDNGDFFDVALMSLDLNYDNIKGLGFTVYNSDKNNKQYKPGTPISLYIYSSIKLIRKDFYEKNPLLTINLHTTILEEWRKGGVTIAQIYIDYYKSGMIEHLDINSHPFFVPKRPGVANNSEVSFPGWNTLLPSIKDPSRQPRYLPNLVDSKENTEEIVEEYTEEYEYYTPYEHLSVYGQIYEEIKEVFFRLFNKRYRNNSKDEYV